MQGICDDEVAGPTAEMAKHTKTFGDFCPVKIVLALLEEGGCL